MNRSIPQNTQRRLWASSLEVCGNPDCQNELIKNESSIGEIAHIEPYAEGENNEFDNLILLCPNCHTLLDKQKDVETLKRWKNIQRKNIDAIRSKKFKNFSDLKDSVKPLLEKNRLIYEQYYVGQESSVLWEKFEDELLINNKKIRLIFENNLNLFQGTNKFTDNNYSLAQEFILHTEEFEKTRGSNEKLRNVIFPAEINSIFGISPVQEATPYSNVAALQEFIKHLKAKGVFIRLDLIANPPYLQYTDDNDELYTLFLNDLPNLRQIYWDTKSYRNNTSELTFRDLNFFLSWLTRNNLDPYFPDETDLSHVIINKKNLVIMVRKYCLSESDIRELSPQKGIFIVNLFNFIGDFCISKDAYRVGDAMGVKIFTSKAFYKFCHNELLRQ